MRRSLEFLKLLLVIGPLVFKEERLKSYKRNDESLTNVLSTNKNQQVIMQSSIIILPRIINIPH